MSVCISSGAKQIFSSLLEGRLEEVGSATKQGKFVSSLLKEVNSMPVCSVGKTKREPSKWNKCLQKRMKGVPRKEWPTRIKELSKEYKKGTCP